MNSPSGGHDSLEDWVVVDDLKLGSMAKSRAAHRAWLLISVETRGKGASKESVAVDVGRTDDKERRMDHSELEG